MPSKAKVEANQANSKLSTGPITEEGRQTSARNNFRHGLASSQLIAPGESQQDFDELLQSFLAEHAPATPTESALVAQMAQHFWFSQRALGLQTQSLANDADPAKLSLYLRYQTSHDRAFHRSFQMFTKLRRERVGFESQKQNDALVPLQQARIQEVHAVKLRLLNSRANNLRDAMPFQQRQPNIVPTSSQALFDLTLNSYLGEPSPEAAQPAI